MNSPARIHWQLPFAAVLAAMFSLQLSNLAFPPLLPSIQRDTGMNFSQLGMFTGLYGLLAMLLSVPAGISAHRFGEKQVLVAGLVVVAAGSLLLGQAHDFESAIGWRSLVIFGYRFAFVSVLVAVALTAPPSLRGRTMGILGATSAMASVIGAPLGGHLVDEQGWRTAIVGYAAMAVLGAAIFWAFYRPVHAAPAAPDPHVAAASSSRSAFRSPVVWLIALIVGMGGFGQFTITHFVPSVASALYGLDAGAAGIMISTGYLAAIAANLIVGMLADRFNRLLVLGLVFALLGCASACMNIADETAFRISTASVIGLGFAATNQLYGLAAHVMPRREAGNAMGIVSLGAGLFGFLGPQMLGVLRDLTGSFAAGFYMVVVADAITLALIFQLHRLTRRNS